MLIILQNKTNFYILTNSTNSYMGGRGGGWWKLKEANTSHNSEEQIKNVIKGSMVETGANVICVPS